MQKNIYELKKLNKDDDVFNDEGVNKNRSSVDDLTLDDPKLKTVSMENIKKFKSIITKIMFIIISSLATCFMCGVFCACVFIILIAGIGSLYLETLLPNIPDLRDFVINAIIFGVFYLLIVLILICVCGCINLATCCYTKNFFDICRKSPKKKDLF